MNAPERLLLDTHVWLWLALGASNRLRPPIVKAIEAAGQSRGVLISIVSVWELAMLVNRRRVTLPMPVHEWISVALSRPELRLVGLSRVNTVLDSVNLPGALHADPADRFLIATARNQAATLVTRDEAIIDYGKAGHVKVLAA